jgi:HAAS domain-containing protein
MTSNPHPAVAQYLGRLERSLGDLPVAQRREIVAEIEEHVTAALAEIGPEPSEASVRNMLERLGEPAAVAAEARERFGARAKKARWTDPVAIFLLLFGGFLFVVGWVAGLVLLWTSDAWDLRDKLIGTLVVPGGLATAGAASIMSIGDGGCDTPVPVGGAISPPSCPASRPDVWSVILLGVLVIAPIVTAIYLSRRLQRARATNLAELATA